MMYEPVYERGKYLITNISDTSSLNINRIKNAVKEANKKRGFSYSLGEASSVAKGLEWKGLWANAKGHDHRQVIWDLLDKLKD